MFDGLKMLNQRYDKCVTKCVVPHIIIIVLITLATTCHPFKLSEHCEILENELNKTHIVCPIISIANADIKNIIRNIPEINFIHVEDNYGNLQLHNITSKDKYNAINAIQPNHNRSPNRENILENDRDLKVTFTVKNETQEQIDASLSNVDVLNSESVNVSLSNANLHIFATMTELKNLNVCCNMLSLNTTPLAEINKLQSLGLSKHNFEHLTKQSFLGVKQLNKLILVNNHIQKIDSDAFTLMTKLEIILLKHNRIAVLPKALLINNTNLQLFEMLCDSIGELPDELFARLPQLIRFTMRCNMTSVPDHLFTDSVSITVIDLSSNALETLPPTLFKSLRNLHLLQLEHNLLTTLPDFLFTDMINLKELKLSNNRFTKIDCLLNLGLNLHTIGFIDLSYNSIRDIADQDYVFVQHGAQVNLSSNLISDVKISKIDNELPTRGKFILTNNPYDCSCLKIRQIIEFASKLSHPFHIDGLKCETPADMFGKHVSSIDTGDLLCEYPAPPGCSTRTDETKRIMIMNCSNAKLIEVPQLPNFSNDFDALELHIDNNVITELPELNTTTNITKIFAANNSIKEIFPINIPKNLITFDVSNNSLRVISRTTAMTLKATSSLQNISFRGNQWICECDESMVSLLEIEKMIEDSKDMKCNDGTKTMQFAVICWTEYENLIIVIALVAIVFAVSLSVLYYCNRETILVWLYAHNMCMCCIKEDELDRDKQYDAFLSISPEDDDFIFDNILHELECGPMHFRICWPIRDWLPGEFINQLIMDSVKNSCRTIIVLSPNFLRSIWGRMEFRAAHTSAMKDGISRLIIILCEDVGDVGDLDPLIRSYLKINTFLRWGDPRFFDKLRYALPHRRQKMTATETQHTCFHINQVALTEHQLDLPKNTGKSDSKRNLNSSC